MKTLGIDTTTKNGGVILGSRGVNIGIRSLDNPREYSDQIIPAIEKLLAQNRLRLQEIELIAVANGPGGFTGVRVGLAVAKAISQSLKIPSIGISTLEALAYRFRETTSLIAPMIDAQRGQVYAAIYRFNGDEPVLIAPEVLAVPEVWLESLSEGISPLFVGTGTGSHREEISFYSSEAQVGPSDDCILDSLLQLANMKSSKAATATELVANYIRPSDAEAGSAASSSATMEYED